MTNINHSSKIFIILAMITLSAIFLIQITFAANNPDHIDSHIAPAEDSAVILLYHRFNEEKYPTTSISRDQFARHLAELKKKKYNVLPLTRITESFANKTKLPNRAIAITIDDAFASVYEVAYPMLKKANMPFTLFVSTLTVEKKGRDYLSWDQIREMAEDPLVTIGHHGHGHISLAKVSAENALADLKKASEIYKKELNFQPKIFAYPYGEFSEGLKEQLKSIGIKAAFAQYSSAANSHSDQLSLPRFALNDKYGDDSRFRVVINTRALPVRDILPRQAVLNGNNPPLIGFTVDKRVKYLKKLRCFPSHLGKEAQITILGGNRVEIRFDKEYPKGRGRLNCTMPGPNKRHYWFGLTFFVF
jgi:peptidoglycan/xylan/chitin deacetylase (PgdA/CDA1 family)